LMGYIQRHK